MFARYSTIPKYRRKTHTRVYAFALLALCACVQRPLSAQTDTFIAGSGDWSRPQAWSRHQLPNRNENCVIPAGSSPIGDIGIECLGFSMGSGATLLITPGYLFVYASLVNPGTITVGPGDGMAFEHNGGTATISGGGTITLSNGSLGTGQGLGDTVDNVDNVINGQGFIGVYQFNNQSRINANVPSGTLQLHASFSGGTNTGTLEASNGGILSLAPQASLTPLTNTGGIIQALNGSVVQVVGYAITGGTLTTSGSGTIQNLNTSLYNNLTNNGAFQVINGNNAILQGTIVNNGTFTATNGGFLIDRTVTLKGPGSVAGGNGPFFHSYNGASNLIVQQPISGGGSIGDGTFTLTNQSTITANNPSSNLVLGGNPEVNTGTLAARNSATLEIQNTVTNTVGTVTAQDKSTVLLDFSGTISGGTLTTSGTGSFQTTSGTLDGSTNAVNNAGLFSVATGDTLSLKGTINNTGTFAVAGCLGMSAPTTLTGSGTVQLTGNGCLFGWAVTNNLTNQSTIEGSGSIGDSNPMGFTNAGTVIANQPNSLTIVSAGSGFSNPGNLFVNAGSTLNINGQLHNLSKGVLTGGTYSVAGTMQLENANYTTIATNSANITLTGSGAQILNGNGGPSALAAFAKNSPKGMFSVQGGQVLATTASFTNQGTMTVGGGSGFGTPGIYTQTGGMTTLDGVLSAPTGFALEKGTLLGTGMIAGPLTAAASVTAGDSPSKSGILSVSSYSQTSTGSLNIPISSTVAGSGYGQLASSNGVTLAGKLVIKRVNGYVPPIGSTFTIVKGSAISGQFASVNLGINSHEHFTITYNRTTVVLTVVGT